MNKVKQGFIDLLNEPLWFRIMIAITGLFIIPFLGMITAIILKI